MLDYYQILEIDSSSSIDEIKKAYHKLALKYHPDHNSETAEKFGKIKEAYEHLVKNHSSPKLNSFDRMFTDMFRTMKNNINIVHTIRVNLPLKEALVGTKKNLNIKFDIHCPLCGPFTARNCKSCKGLGYTSEQFSSYFEFSNIKSQDQSFLFKKVYRDIDLRIIVSIDPLDNLKIRGKYLEIDENLSIFRAITGGAYEINTPLGTVRCIIPYGNISNFSVTVRNSYINWENVKINFNLFLPKNLTDSQIKMLTDMV